MLYMYLYLFPTTIIVPFLVFHSYQRCQPLMALQEYEGHFSGIWVHFPECHIFRHKRTKFTHTCFLKDELQYSLIQYPLPPPKCMAESFTSTSCIIFSSLQLVSVRAKDLYNLMNFGIHTTFWPRNPFCFASQAGSRTSNFLPAKVTSFQ